MSVEIIQQRLLSYNSQNILEQENALKEIAQEVALLALSRADFFGVAAFQGGTCLRILYGLDRFSEDLDFILRKPDKEFNWDNYIKNMQEEFNAYGYSLEVANRSKVDNVVKKTFLKADSQGGLLILNDIRTNRPKIQIKLEVDTNPPAGSDFELKYLDFPLPFSVESQDLPSLFAGKCHALLCREYVKGRDWFDFIWYVARNIKINLSFLSNALHQQGSWQNKSVNVTPVWLITHLDEKIKSLNWADAKKDVARFLKPRELASLEVWSTEFFLSRTQKLAGYL